MGSELTFRRQMRGRDRGREGEREMSVERKIKSSRLRVGKKEG